MARLQSVRFVALWTRSGIVGKYVTIEALGIMLPKTDPEFKQIVDGEMKRLPSSHPNGKLWPPIGISACLPVTRLASSISRQNASHCSPLQSHPP